MKKEPQNNHSHAARQHPYRITGCCFMERRSINKPISRMLDESASLYCRSSFRSEIITVTCRDSRAHSRDYTKKLVICSCHVSFYTYSRTRSPILSITKTNIILVNLMKCSEIDASPPIDSRTTELHTTKYTMEYCVHDH